MDKKAFYDGFAKQAGLASGALQAIKGIKGIVSKGGLPRTAITAKPLSTLGQVKNTAAANKAIDRMGSPVTNALKK